MGGGGVGGSGRGEWVCGGGDQNHRKTMEDYGKPALHLGKWAPNGLLSSLLFELGLEDLLPYLAPGGWPGALSSTVSADALVWPKDGLLMGYPPFCSAMLWTLGLPGFEAVPFSLPEFTVWLNCFCDPLPLVERLGRYSSFLSMRPHVPGLASQPARFTLMSVTNKNKAKQVAAELSK